MAAPHELGVMLAIAHDAADRSRDVADVERVEVLGGVAAGLGQRGRAGRDDRHAAGHRLDEHEPEPLVKRRVHERVGAAHERVQPRVGEVAGQADGAAAAAARRRSASGPLSIPASTRRCGNPSLRRRLKASTNRMRFFFGRRSPTASR